MKLWESLKRLQDMTPSGSLEEEGRKEHIKINWENVKCLSQSTKKHAGTQELMICSLGELWFKVIKQLRGGGDNLSQMFHYNTNPGIRKLDVYEHSWTDIEVACAIYIGINTCADRRVWS